ncbi:agglutinin biogenesis protein MshI [Undibacterium sp. LX40W]|uniref:Agglutinin biogenesis protein MshI n=1 Tax=Undibacterium nitidum TaxID=2762298 RepID=A0A923HVI4_9BURK|nr:MULTISPECIES: agglutinin biogenesis protein MshI [Undibacterium]MBC3882114.1 agglutinin biogenesis protein MshI [Undibacterium nitidum]MBC3892395.1 agglutinin biogenesis protein MshI [Undibacterium sp. LX40W]
MRFFSKNKKNIDVMAISIAQDGLYSAVIRREPVGRPVLEFLSFYPLAGLGIPVLLERLAKESPARERRRSLCLQQGDYQVLALDAMNVPSNELKGALQWRIKEMVDFPVAEATIDYLHVPGDVSAGGRNQSLLVIVAKNQLIQQQQNLFQNAKLPLSFIDIPEAAQRNISTCLEVAGRGLAMLSFDQNGGLLTVTFGGELYLSRRLDLNLDQLNQQDDEGQRAVFERVSLELQRSLDHFDRQHNYITTAKLVISPLGKVAHALQAFLAANLYMPVEVMDLGDVIELAKVPELKESVQQQKFFGIIGAALRTEVGDA